MNGPQSVEARVAEIKSMRRDKRLEALNAERDPDVLGRFALQSRGGEQIEAIEALGNSGSADAAPYLIALFSTDTRDRFRQTVVNAALGRVGSPAAIPHLVRFIHSPIEDVKASAIAALSALGDADLTPVFLDALTDRSWVAKWYAMQAIAEHADERAIEAVVERVKVILSRKPKTNIGSDSELVYALRFLTRWSAVSVAAQAAIAWAATRRDFMRDQELVWFEATIGAGQI